MSKTSTTTTTDPEAVNEAPVEDAAETTEATAEGPNAEAAKYRVRAREAEAERDQLRDQIDGMRRTAAEKASGLRSPAILWQAGHAPSDFYTDAGDLDHEALRSVVDNLRTAAAPVGGTPKPDRTQGGAVENWTGADTIANALKEARGQ